MLPFDYTQMIIFASMLIILSVMGTIGNIITIRTILTSTSLKTYV